MSPLLLGRILSVGAALEPADWAAYKVYLRGSIHRLARG